ncbi:hypothetical protein LX36DRAFT_587346, partial [Colletotrichum falcatum]
LNLKAPRRFKFTLRDNYKFNYKIYVNIVYLNSNKPMLHVVNSVIAFNAA